MEAVNIIIRREDESSKEEGQKEEIIRLNKYERYSLRLCQYLGIVNDDAHRNNCFLVILCIFVFIPTIFVIIYFLILINT